MGPATQVPYTAPKSEHHAQAYILRKSTDRGELVEYGIAHFFAARRNAARAATQTEYLPPVTCVFSL